VGAVCWPASATGRHNSAPAQSKPQVTGDAGEGVDEADGGHGGPAVDMG